MIKHSSIKIVQFQFVVPCYLGWKNLAC